MQGFSAGGMKTVGIVGTLVLIGIILKTTNIAATLGEIAMSMGVLIGIVLGLLGIFAVAKRIVG
ncbi:MAG: hypothetical protein WC916_02930 [Candidatus Woesearchaeota archaeon]